MKGEGRWPEMREGGGWWKKTEKASGGVRK